MFSLQHRQITTFVTVEKHSVRIINKSNNPLPKYATEGSSGMDLRADLKEEIILQPLERGLIQPDCL